MALRSGDAVNSLTNFAGEFNTSVDYVEASAVVTARGELDLATAPQLGEALNGVIDRGARSVIVDMADLAFTDVSGLRVLILGAQRMTAAGGTLRLRSPSRTVRRLLDFFNVSELAETHPKAVRHHLEPAQALPQTKHGGWPASDRQADAVLPPEAIPSDADLVDAALRLVVTLARATVGGADGVSVSLRRHGRLVTVAASDQTISDMDEDQYTTGEGPCVAASIEGRWFHVESLDMEGRWPEFIPQAKQLGINAILSSPLLVDDRPVGALNIYSRTAGAFASSDQHLASLFAAEASTILAAAQVDVSDEQWSDRLTEALQTRQDIAQAQGVIMGSDGVDAATAYAKLRRVSVTTDVPLAAIARDLVDAIRHRGSGTPDDSRADQS